MQKILLSDDHSIVRRGLKQILGIHFSSYSVDECLSVAETLNYLQYAKPDFAILDLQLSDGNMLDVLPQIIAKYPQLNVFIYSMCNEDIYGKRVLQVGAKGFLSKTADDGEVLRALQIFLSGQSYISSKLSNTLVASFQKKKKEQLGNPFSSLSNREMEVAQFLLTGQSVKAISNKMNLHANTIVTYKNRIFEKLSVTNIVEFTKVARLYDIHA